MADCLRTGSNLSDAIPEDAAASSNIGGLKRGEYSALMPAFAAAHQVDRIAVKEIVPHWDKYAETIPTGH